MNKKKLLSVLKAQGYTGAEDATAILEWLKTSNITLTDQEGKSIDIAAVFSAKTITVSSPDPSDDTTLGDPDETKQADANEADAKSWRSLQASKRIAAVHSKEDRGTTTLTMNGRKFAQDRYKAKIKSGKATFSDVETAEFFGAFMRKAILFPGKSYPQAENDAEIIKTLGGPEWHQKVQAEYTNVVGGALVPVEFLPNLLWLTEKYGISRRMATVVRMSREVMDIPQQTALNTAYWTGEGVAGTASDASFKVLTLTARKLLALTYFTNELLADSAINIADTLARNFAEAFNYAIDNAYFNGDGTSTYGGNIGLANGLVSGAYQGLAANWLAFDNDDILQIMGSVENVNAANLAFACSRQAYVNILLRLAQAKGGVTTGEIVTGTGMFSAPREDGVFAVYQGFPVYEVQVMPTATAATSIALYFGDFRNGSHMGMREEMSISSSSEYAFNQDLMTYRATSRWAININGDGRGTTYGPIVALKTT